MNSSEAKKKILSNPKVKKEWEKSCLQFIKEHGFDFETSTSTISKQLLYLEIPRNSE